MRQRGGGFGFIVLLIAGLIVFILAAKNWQKVAGVAIGTPAADTQSREALEAVSDQKKPPAPAGLDVSNSELTRPIAPATNPIRSHLQDMQKQVDAHTKATKEAAAGAQ